MRSLRFKMMLMAVVVVFIPVYLLNRYAISFFDLYTRTAFEKNMRHYAFIVGEQYKLGFGDSRPDSEQAVFDQEREQLFARIGHEVNARICVFDKDGSLLFDSDCGDGDGEILRERYEVVEALKGSYSARSRLSEDRQFMYYYIAQPIKDDEKNMLGVAYVVAHTNPIVQAIQRMVANQRLATYIALACAGLVALVLALTMTRRLRLLMRETRAFAAGRKPLGKPLRGGDEIAELGRSIHSMADEMESRNSYNRDFIQTTLHELKTPLTAIRGAAEVLESLERGAGGSVGVCGCGSGEGKGFKNGVGSRDREKSDQGKVAPASPKPRAVQGENHNSKKIRQKFLGKIEFQVGRLMQLVGGLRELTRVDVEISQAVREDVDYCVFVKDAVDRLSDTFSEPHANLIVELPEIKLQLSIVPGRIEQVLANLLDNAFRYTPHSGQVAVKVEMGGGCVRTLINDTGSGIADSNIERVFDRFFTTERSQRQRDYGSGLGLAIVDSIIRSHQGKIWVESEVGKGTRFVFEIPV